MKNFIGSGFLCLTSIMNNVSAIINISINVICEP